MKRWAVLALLVSLLAACGGDAPTRPGADTIDRAREVADQLEERVGDLQGVLGE